MSKGSTNDHILFYLYFTQRSDFLGTAVKLQCEALVSIKEFPGKGLIIGSGFTSRHDLGRDWAACFI